MNNDKKVIINDNCKLVYREKNYKTKDGKDGLLKQLVLVIRKKEDDNTYSLQEIVLSNEKNYKIINALVYYGVIQLN